MNTFSVAFLAMGFLFLFLTLVIYITNQDKKNKFSKYCHTTGVITSSAMNGYNYNHGKNPNAKLGYGNAYYSMVHRIYEYEVNGKKYSRAEDPAVTKSVFNHDLGKTVDVYYDEKNPKKSFIVVPGRSDGLDALTIVFLCFSAFFIVFGLLFLIIL
ncbi:MAG: DUF3592 domain-containing protein [Bacilli bacterium]|nr:DUF3592 domain-containing protein [Bacilli bacterium]